MLALIQELVEGIWRVNRLVFFCGVLAGILENDLGATGMFG